MPARRAERPEEGASDQLPADPAASPPPEVPAPEAPAPEPAAGTLLPPAPVSDEAPPASEPPVDEAPPAETETVDAPPIQDGAPESTEGTTDANAAEEPAGAPVELVEVELDGRRFLACPAPATRGLYSARSEGETLVCAAHEAALTSEDTIRVEDLPPDSGTCCYLEPVPHDEASTDRPSADAATDADPLEPFATEAMLGDSFCPHCMGELEPHEGPNPATAGALHCNDCGCCFLDREPRPGHPLCRDAELDLLESR